MEQPALPALSGLPDLPEVWEQQERQERLVLRVLREVLVLPVPWAQQEVLEPPVRPVLPVPQEVSVLREASDQPEEWVHRELLARSVLQELAA